MLPEDASELPESKEIEKQLEIIVNSRAFGNHLKPGKLLRRLVEAHAKREEIDDYTLGIEVFGRPRGWLPKRESAVREGKSLLRKALQEYYATEGRDDQVILELPKRGSLQATYNPNFSAAVLVRTALKMMGETFPKVIDRYSCGVTAMLEECIEKYPDYAPAHVALAEALLVYTACDHWDSFPARRSIKKAEENVAKAIELAPSACRAHLIAGALHCCRFEWEEADKSFNNAMEIDALQTTRSGFYIIFLKIVGRHQKLRDAMAVKSSLVEDDRHTRVLSALLAYLEDSDGAYMELRECATDPNSLEIDPRYQRGERLLEFDSWQASLIAAGICLRRGWTELATRYADRGMLDSGVGAYLGFVVLASAAHGKTDSEFSRIAENYFQQCLDVNEPRAFSLPREPKPVSAFSRALGYLGMENPAMAIEMLSQAADEGFPLVALVSICPLFSDLHSHPNYAELKSRMNIP